MPSRYDFSGRVALLTGAASGIGRAAAERLLASGGQVAILDRRRGAGGGRRRARSARWRCRGRRHALVRGRRGRCRASSRSSAGSTSSSARAGVGGDSLQTERGLGRRVGARLRRQLPRRLLLQPRRRPGDDAARVTVASSTSPRSRARRATRWPRPTRRRKAAVIAMTKSIGKDLVGTGVLVNSIAPAVDRDADARPAHGGAPRLHGLAHPARPARPAGGGRGARSASWRATR